MKTIRAIAMTGVLVAAASCAPKPTPEPVRPPVRIEAPSAPLIPPPPPAAVLGWEDMALTAGEWRFDEAAPAATYGGVFTVRCDPATRRVTLARTGAPSSITFRTSYGARTVSSGAGGVVLSASDALLDQILFSRGRFAVEAEGQTRLILPTWPEPARVVEECRG